MWRIYSPDKRSARIKVRLPDLFAALSTYAIGVPFIGKVKYLRLKPWAQRLVRSTSNPSLELLAKTFLVKRPAFPTKTKSDYSTTRTEIRTEDGYIAIHSIVIA